jgi:hypothetical protein
MGLWKDEYVFTTYELARSGCNQKRIAEVLGVSKPTFLKWKRKYPELRNALRKGCVGARGCQSNQFTFRDLVQKRLPPQLRKIWTRINRFETERSGTTKIEMLLQQQGKQVRQYLFIHALMVSNFNSSIARQKVNVDRKTLQRWIEEDPDFLALVDEIEQCKKDFFEDCLLKLCTGLDTTAVVMANRTYNADRGYGEQTRHRHEHEVSGTIEHKVSRLDELPLELQKQILDEMRRKQIPSRIIEKDNGNGEDDGNGDR